MGSSQYDYLISNECVTGVTNNLPNLTVFRTCKAVSNIGDDELGDASALRLVLKSRHIEQLSIAQDRHFPRFCLEQIKTRQ